MARPDDLHNKRPMPSKSAGIDETMLLETGKGFIDYASLDKMFRVMGYGGAGSAIVDTLYGTNIMGTAPPAPTVNEHQGLTFFTRPLLNLSYHNIRNDPSFTHMLSEERSSLASFVQATLDPLGNHNCPLVDPASAFIPLLGNTLISLSGWQEAILNTWTSSPDRMKGQISIGDSATDVNGVFPLSATFRNIRRNPLNYLFHCWVRYIGLVKSGVFDPYPEFMAYNIKDYESRCYRVILDPTRQYVEEITCNFACFPTADRSAIRADLSDAGPSLKENDTYNQTFESTGARYFDPRTMYDFNEAATMFNPILANPATRKSQMRRLWPQEYQTLSFRSYPLINTSTAELEWWIPNEVHARILGKVPYAGY